MSSQPRVPASLYLLSQRLATLAVSGRSVTAEAKSQAAAAVAERRLQARRGGRR
jgi:hypothetical protein